MYEHSALPPVPTSRFLARLLRHAGYGAALIALSLAAGTIGFTTLAAQSPIDAFLNAAMLLGGMGPIGDLSRASTGGKLFAAFFALYAGLVFLVLAALLLTPVFHRVLHRFHW
ncbi:MAG TPA: hypothetical protein VGD77_01615, partial [Gemmatimonadaceae bacterium]